RAMSKAIIPQCFVYRKNLGDEYFKLTIPLKGVPIPNNLFLEHPRFLRCRYVLTVNGQVLTGLRTVRNAAPGWYYGSWRDEKNSFVIVRLSRSSKDYSERLELYLFKKWAPAPGQEVRFFKQATENARFRLNSSPAN